MAEDKDKAAARAAEDRRNAKQQRNDEIDRRVREGREQMVERNNAALDAERTAKPTPTPEECDAAALGRHVANKEDDGSGPDLHLHRSAAADGAAPYMTREAKVTEVRRETQETKQDPAGSGSSSGFSSGQQQSKDGDKKK
jgi:hypothetical protein